MLLPKTPYNVRKRSRVRLHKAEVAARFEYAVDLSNGYAYIWMNVVQTANNRDAVKRIISKTGTEQRPSFRFAIGPSVSERIYDLA